ncbi:hypothetical protein DFH94DRAFT_230964 [Russula ochroleuca]|uniref:Mon2/Sec7/BIG1-like HDS domain-containing protein n=1 Tax=Russula ochroleuca TaxID=152965 RepID=A0A9P5MLX4_9AGAM|nr:hypothetical protein DFH94DRAFT_230964 [Russula ochroleuca]
MRFLEKKKRGITALKFQTDFLGPFEHTKTRSANPEIRDVVLQCLQHVIQVCVQNMLGLTENIRCFPCGFQILDRHVRVVYSAIYLAPTERITSSACCYPGEQGALCGLCLIRRLCRSDGLHP